MTILDDAREGMNLDIRPQDDLFGHVNGTWLDTAEIPADRSSWGPFVTLADRAEEQVRAIITELSEGSAGDVANAEDARKIADLYSTFMDTEAINAAGSEPIRLLRVQPAGKQAMDADAWWRGLGRDSAVLS